MTKARKSHGLGTLPRPLMTSLRVLVVSARSDCQAKRPRAGPARRGARNPATFRMSRLERGRARVAVSEAMGGTPQGAT
ncbi:MAG: hypothetical protein AB7G38_13995, partial [Dehalococcoidia bacterium]